MTRKKSAHSNRIKKTSFIVFSILFSFLIALMVFPSHEGQCAQVSLAWDPDNVSNLAGYKIYYGTASGNYQWNVDVGNVTNYPLGNLTIGSTYYAAATAYTNSGAESTYSNEVAFTVPSCTYAISPASASFPASGGTGAVSITTYPYCNWTTSASIPWITVTSGSGLGNGTMSYSVSPNTGTTSQTASITIAGKVFTVTESGQATYTITASAGSGGSISPSGQVSVQSGSGQGFTITPNTGYKIAGVLVDGVSQGTVGSYTFSNVQANHTISASFTASTYTLSVSKSGAGGGTVSTNPSGTTFPAGTVVTLTASPDSNSVFSEWSGACSGTSTTCQVTMNSNLNVTATFNAKTNTTYIITATASGGGTLSPSGNVTVTRGASQTFKITPNKRHRIINVQVDGVWKGSITSYTFSNITANHQISAVFSR
jgi:hypothetical protein